MSDADDVTRRGFLKGLIAAAALATISPAVLESLVVAEVTTPGLELAGGFGDLWLRGADRRWRFVGTMLSMEMQRPTIPIITMDQPFVTYATVDDVTAAIDLATDDVGNALLEHFLFGEQVDVGIGLERERHCIVCNAFITGVGEIAIARGEPLTRRVYLAFGRRAMRIESAAISNLETTYNR